MFVITPEYGWLIAGSAFFIIEIFIVTGFGFLFAGAAAICLGGAIAFGAIAPENLLVQLTVFFLLIPVWLAILWKPLKKLRTKNGQSYSNMVGDQATVVDGPLKKDTAGKVTWSGTIMQAELVQDSPVQEVTTGGQVTIVEVKGTTLIVKPVIH